MCWNLDFYFKFEGHLQDDRVLDGTAWKEESIMRICFQAGPVGFNNCPEGAEGGTANPGALVLDSVAQVDLELSILLPQPPKLK